MFLCMCKNKTCWYCEQYSHDYFHLISKKDGYCLKKDKDVYTSDNCEEWSDGWSK